MQTLRLSSCHSSCRRPSWLRRQPCSCHRRQHKAEWDLSSQHLATTFPAGGVDPLRRGQVDPGCTCHPPFFFFFFFFGPELGWCGKERVRPFCWLAAPESGESGAGGPSTFSLHWTHPHLRHAPCSGLSPFPGRCSLRTKWETLQAPSPVRPREIKVPQRGLRVTCVLAL